MKKKYSVPQPTSAIYSMKDQSKTYSDVLKLQEKYGFEYASAIGLLIYVSLNTVQKLMENTLTVDTKVGCCCHLNRGDNSFPRKF
jgi:hypothetical protein